MDRKREQAEQVEGLGRLLAPLQDVVDDPGHHDEASIARACARFTASVGAYRTGVQRFVEGEPGATYNAEYTVINARLNRFEHGLIESRKSPGALRSAIEYLRSEVIGSLLQIPVIVPSHVIAAPAPYVTYRTFKTLADSARRRVVCVDAYMDRTIFHRYLSDVGAAVEVQLVTADKASGARWTEFMDISRLYAAQRGSPAYRLVASASIHDRYLVCDDDAYQLGGSFKDAGARSDCSVTRFGRTQDAVDAIERLVAAGTELFGPTSPTHP